MVIVLQWQRRHTASIGSCGVPWGGITNRKSNESQQNHGNLPLPYPNTHYIRRLQYVRVLPISNLEPVFNEISKGKSQKYNVTKKARLQDQVDFSSTIFGSSLTVDGKNN
eukprot:scaffold2649_cov100-Skeletonema_dohrnii-CCMP3373.AAC.7